MHCTGAYRGCAASPHLIGHVRFSQQRLLRLRLLRRGSAARAIRSASTVHVLWALHYANELRTVRTDYLPVGRIT